MPRPKFQDPSPYADSKPITQRLDYLLDLVEEALSRPGANPPPPPKKK